MPKLSRTEKYAGYRESLANDRESSWSTKEMSGFQDQLANMNEQFSASAGQNTTADYNTVKTSEFEEEKYVWKNFEDPTPIEEVVNDFHSEELDKTVESLRNDSPIWNALQEAPAVQPETVQNTSGREPEIATLAEPVHQDNFNETFVMPPFDEFIDNAPKAENYISNTNNVQTNTADVYQNNTDAFNAYNDYQAQNATGLYGTADNYTKTDTYVQPEDFVEIKIESSQPETAAPVADIPLQQPADNHVIDHSADELNTYLSDTINEVSSYNEAQGAQTISQLTSNMVNEVRHREDQTVRPQYGTYDQYDPLKSADDDYSNTVSTEISKIMDEISHVDTRAQETVTPRPVEQVRPVEEHPVMAKALEEEKPEVEIKNLKELEAEEATITTNVRDTISSTIPFVVASEGEDIIDDDDDDEGSNTILNIILIVLIVVLVAVLGLIVFYILKTKGII